MNKPKYYLTNGHVVIGIVYESDKYGRTLLVTGNLDVNQSLDVRDTYANKILDIDLIEFLYGMIPASQENINEQKI
jgi:hypothetical protein